MNWVVLVCSGVMESVWAIALDRSQGFSQLVPTIVFVVALAASMFGLSWATRSIPMGTGYAVWVGIGAALTAAYGMIAGGESFSIAKVLLLVALMACVIGLKLVSE